jgi:hypothetical protein
MKTNHSSTFTVLMVLVVILFHSQIGVSQPKEKEFQKMDYSKWMVFIPGNDSIDPFFISTKPITNKEYILYLVWTEKVYVSYPKAYLDNLPGLNDKARQYEYLRPFSDSVSFRYYLDNAESYVANYMFNPEYINYPVIGISWEQANKFCHWLSDRYNEYSLLNKNYLTIELYQRDADNFSTESFILGQYTGTINKPLPIFTNPKTAKGFDYMNYYLRPSFHLATRYELKMCSKMILPTVTKNLYNVFDKYSEDCCEFLKLFYENYLPKQKGYIYVDPEPYGKENKTYYLSSDKYYEGIKLPAKFSEWCLDSYVETEGYSIAGIYQKYGFELEYFQKIISIEDSYLAPRKDSLGLSPFIIIGENKNREIEMVKAPVGLKKSKKIATPYLYDNKSGTVVNRNCDIFTCFRYAVNVIRKQ